MSMEVALGKLAQAVNGLATSLSNVLWAVSEAKPQDAEHALAERYADMVSEVLGWAQDAAAQASEAATFIDPVRAARMLGTCHEQSIRVRQGYWAGPSSPEGLVELEILGREHPVEWLAWATGVTEEVRRCREPMAEVDLAILECWKEIIERARAGSITVQSTGIERQVVLALERSEAPEGPL